MAKPGLVWEPLESLGNISFVWGSGWILAANGDEKPKHCMAPGLVKGHCLTVISRPFKGLCKGTLGHV